jgi:hypothetical protein
MITVGDCRLLDLPRIAQPGRGSITPVEGGKDVPFDIARVYYLYDIPGGESRGGHAHKELEQVIVAALGSFEVEVDDGSNKKTLTLNRSYHGFYLPRLIWRELKNFSSGAICLVLASQPFREEEYLRDHAEFIRHRNSLP